MNFEQIRTENDEQFLSQLDSITSAENIRVLIPFAKAYLGLFYVIDHDLAAKDKVRLLSNTQLSEAIFKGFLASLKRNNLPSAEEIGHAMAEKKEYAEGYVILAGLDLLAKNSISAIGLLEQHIIEKAVAFHFSNQSGFNNIWFDYLLTEHIDKITPAISQYWKAMLKNNAMFLPGKSLVLGDKANSYIMKYSTLLLLENWIKCKEKTLTQLLHVAFKYSDLNHFLIVCENALEHDENLNEKTRLYWLVSAYLLSPEKYFAKLSNYVGRIKLKIMPLLDFITLLLADQNNTKLEIKTKTLTQLVRMIAPVFPPQHHVYGALGMLDINSRNVMLMFYALVCSNNNDIAAELKSLRKARVMKIYSAVIDNVLEIQMRKKNEEGFLLPTFDDYIGTLAKNDCLHGRSNKFDLR